MTNKEKAEAYVRQALPELMEPKAGCRLICKGDAWHEHGIMIRGDKLSNITTGKIEERDDSWEIVGHPIQLQHWLRVLRKKTRFLVQELNDENLIQIFFIHEVKINFNLTTGQPATEEDYQAFNDIVGI